MKKNIKIISSILIPILILLMAQVLSQVIGTILEKTFLGVFLANSISGISYVFLTFYLLKLYANKILDKDLSDFNIKNKLAEKNFFFLAFILPISVIAIYLIFFDGEFLDNNLSKSQILSYISSGIFYTGLGAGLVEEMVFRGFILNSLRSAFNEKIAIILPSLLFAILHLVGIEFNILVYMQIILAGFLVGLMFSLISLYNENILSSALVHSIWNIFMIGGILNIGDFSKYSIFNYKLLSENIFFTGASFGIEVSIISIIAYLLVIIWLLSKRKK